MKMPVSDLPVETASGDAIELSPTLQGPASRRSTATAKEPESLETATGIHDRSNFCAPSLDQVTLVKRKREWSYPQGLRLEHNLHWAIGLLELANAGDFAANIWNDTPVPVYAIVFMAIGATAAGVLSVFAFRDASKAWHNVKFLRRQRRGLQDHKTQLLEEAQPTQQVDVFLDITKRELYTEVINRWGMDILMGGGAILISAGTYLAIGGANHKVWLASNILSGYVGNAPIALYGLVNSFWAVVMWRRKHSHSIAAKKQLQGTVALGIVKKYCFSVELFFALNGPTTLIGGVASMLAATRWWAYVILIPVIISSFFCNYWWRKRAGYDRPYLDLQTNMNAAGLVRALESAAEIRRAIQKGEAGDAWRQLVSDTGSLSTVLDFLVDHGMFETFALRLVEDLRVRTILCDDATDRVDMGVDGLLALPDHHQAIILDTAAQFIRKEGPKHFEHRQRFIAEVLGTYLSKVDTESNPREEEKLDVTQAVSSQST
ncbi:hypothetical protein EDB81DRAFT_783804 [Dactylonectria macrodidyma]|uniref:Integral membrane protein n=1 Tax=Dactylonectria macrodidyma TaxID=307937 RepID=A0A9P9JD60_9HYPO|nr:hypothetical protein EDB81DRAFT_783804 [Dactylonectria macrodidyma]